VNVLRSPEGGFFPFLFSFCFAFFPIFYSIFPNFPPTPMTQEALFLVRSLSALTCVIHTRLLCSIYVQSLRASLLRIPGTCFISCYGVRFFTRFSFFFSSVLLLIVRLPPLPVIKSVMLSFLFSLYPADPLLTVIQFECVCTPHSLFRAH